MRQNSIIVQAILLALGREDGQAILDMGSTN